jgi:hypothetical protein
MPEYLPAFFHITKCNILNRFTDWYLYVAAGFTDERAKNLYEQAYAAKQVFVYKLGSLV